MQIKETDNGNYYTLIPEGDLDANSSIGMDAKISGLIQENRYNIHIDCLGLKYISSPGLGVFISYMDELRGNGGKFVFSNMPDNVFEVFKLLGLHQLVTIVSDPGAVEKAFAE